jgi:hypothetical protein
MLDECVVSEKQLDVCKIVCERVLHDELLARFP